MMHVPGGQLAQPPAADHGQDGRQNVFVLLDCLGGAADESLAQPVFGSAPDRVVRGCPHAGLELVVKFLQPVLDNGFVLAGDLARIRFPFGPNPRLTTPRHRPWQCRCLSLSRHGTSASCSKKIPSSPQPRRELMVPC